MKRLLAFIFSMLCLLSCFCKAEVIEGIGVVAGAWDFSEEESVNPILDPNADIGFAFVVDPPIGYWVGAFNGALIALADSAFEVLTTSPEDTTLYDWTLPAFPGVTYVVRTTERHYAKFKPIQILIPIIQYAYQPDGSRLLVDPVPVKPTTWGRIKLLYN